MNLDDQVFHSPTQAGIDNHVTKEDLLKQVSLLLLKSQLAQSAEFAREGRYDDALQSISELKKEHQDNPAILDLQARIIAQQGNLKDAELLWKQALVLDPENKAYLAALNRIRQISRRPLWLKSFFNLLIGLGLILAGIFLSVFLFNRINPTSLATLPGFQKNQEIQEKILERVAALESSIQSLKTNAHSFKPPDIELNIPGIITRKENNHIVATFEKGIFQKGTIFKKEAKPLLTSLGKQLEPYSGRINLKIYGCTDSIPMPPGQKYRDNMELGRYRALKVYEYLTQTTNLPPNKLLISSYGQSFFPFSNQTPEDRAKNLTVIILISND